MSQQNKNEVVCRPCKEEGGWEVKTPNGKVMPNKFATKAEGMRVARKYAMECGGDLVVENKKSTTSNTSKKKTRK